MAPGPSSYWAALLIKRLDKQANPTDFVKELHAFSDDEILQVMRANVLDLMNGAS